MSQLEKLLGKLKQGTIDGKELVTLLTKLGWEMRNQTGSHQTWSNGSSKLTVLAGRIELKRYQIKEAQSILIKEGK
ncbi:MAG: type II toxin-antitoxin system HicA family toxin [Bdellovibrionia bacterium]